jgi:hypothetical protein
MTTAKVKRLSFEMALYIHPFKTSPLKPVKYFCQIGFTLIPEDERLLRDTSRPTKRSPATREVALSPLVEQR